MVFERIEHAAYALPPRKERGHPQNLFRMYMMNWLLNGDTPEVAEQKARKALGADDFVIDWTGSGE